MAGNTFGTVFKITTFGESHGAAIGVIIDGCPAGIPLTVQDLITDLDKRRPRGNFETARRDEDTPEILSGVFEGKTLGTPIAVEIRNSGARPHDYQMLKSVYRPGHADFAYEAKYRCRDWRGGGRASGRETAARIVAGVIAKKILQHGSLPEKPPCGAITPHLSSIHIEAAAIEIAGISCAPLSTDRDIPQSICDKLAAVKHEGDSIGAIIQYTIRNVPVGLGEPVFDKLDAELAKAILSIGSVKGITFGAGEHLARMRGSEANALDKNHHGGITGGISDGNDIIFQVIVKPVPSIPLQQSAVTHTGEIVEITIPGRHDTCLYRRIIPVIEAMTAIVLADMVLRQKTATIL